MTKSGLRLSQVEETLRTVSSRRLAVYMSAAFSAIHIVYFLMGVRFESGSLAWFWQYIDPILLQERLLQSLFYLHSQPPLFNFFLGVVLKLFPAAYSTAFWVLYLLLGLTLYLALFALMRRLHVSRAVALGLSTLFVASPDFILYEHLLFYTLPLAVILLLSALALDRFLQQPRTSGAFWFFATLFLLSGIASIFHLLYMLLAVLFLGIVAPSNRGMIVKGALIPLLLLSALYLKNGVLFGEFTTNSWVGMNLALMTTDLLSPAERTELIDAGELSALALTDPFEPLSVYPSDYTRTSSYQVPVLEQAKKSTGSPNFNHISYIAISNQYLSDSVSMLRQKPQAYVKALIMGWFTYFKASDDHYQTNEVQLLLEPNQQALRGIATGYDSLFYGKVPFDLAQLGFSFTQGRTGIYLYLFLLVGLPLLFVYGVRLGFTRFKNHHPLLSHEQRVVILFICFNIAYIAVVGNLLIKGENNRQRFMTDPLSLVLLGLFIEQVLVPLLSSAVSKRKLNNA